MGVLRDREIPFRILSLFLFWKTTLDRKGRGLKFPHRGLDIIYCSWQHKRVWRRRLGLREEFSFLLDSIKKPSFFGKVASTRSMESVSLARWNRCWQSITLSL